MQDWMGSQLYRQSSTPTYTDLLEGRTPVGYDAGLVDLSFGLRSGSVEDVTHTVLVNPALGTNHAPPFVGPLGLPDTRGWCSGQSGDERGVLSRRRGAVGTAGVAASRTRTGGSTTPAGRIDGRGDDGEGSAAEVVGRKVWDDHRRQSRQSSTSAITRGVANINVRAGDGFGNCDGAGGEDYAARDGSNDNNEDDDGEMKIRPIGRKRGGSRPKGHKQVYRTARGAERQEGCGRYVDRRDTGVAGGVQMPCPRGGRNESGGSKECGDGQDDDQGSTRDSTFSGVGGGGGGKRKNVRQQTFDTIADVMKPDEGPRESDGDDGGQCEQEAVLNSDEAMRHSGARARSAEGTLREGRPGELHDVQRPSGDAKAGASGGGKAPSSQKGDATASDTRTAAADHSSRSAVAEGAEEARVDDVRRDDGRRDGKREGDDNDDCPLVTRLKGAAKEDDVEERPKLWVDCDAFWGQGPGKPLREAVGDCADYFVAIANGDEGAEPPAMLVMQPNDVSRFKIEDPAKHEPALRRARNVEKQVLRTIHGWIFKSSSRLAGFARAELYISVDFATDIARAVWQGYEWSKVVSPALVYHTRAMKMDVPLWFTGVKIVDRPEDDDMVARQEATVLRVADCWTDEIWCGQWAAGGRVK
ncbi:hypothetical protein CBR_g33949 [Chara braunii]|uniref:Uncharacterized protein n=1 Tax=Chara braunii TaxID=69332 RepID=A0A388LHN5_CHABU|nr:hypothetical protein CBR_g33949 [Chara braunii]|eukprot:GBG81771.1 hypothetical protein CBR_g33949 [Chara braunii]